MSMTSKNEVSNKKRRLSRNQRRILKRKLKKKRLALEKDLEPVPPQDKPQDKGLSSSLASNGNQEIVLEKPFFESIPGFGNFREKFLPIQDEAAENEKERSELDEHKEFYEEKKVEKPKESRISKRQKKLLSQETVSTLKTLVPRPDLVTAHDVNSTDPKFLVYLKSLSNSVPIPTHWDAKHRYLQQNRSRTHTKYSLPDFIRDTSVNRIQKTVNSMSSSRNKTAKQLARERTRPKIGMIDLNFQKLHDAFFKFQKRFYVPKLREDLTLHGRMFQESHDFSDFATKFGRKRVRLGKFSDRTREALGMDKPFSPPPWLLNMQRYGPPPSYPNWSVPGVNGPIPKGAKWGYGKDEWGRPAVDQNNNPLYGDSVLGEGGGDEYSPSGQKRYWGESYSDDEYRVDSDEEESSDEEEEELQEIEEAQEEVEAQEEGSTQAEAAKGEAEGEVEEVEMEEEEEEVVLRKDNSPTEKKELFTVLKEKRTEQGSEILGTDHVYEIVPSKESQSEIADEDHEPHPPDSDSENDEDNFKF
eukprot:maker-scaffold_5-snap-gene-20.11-mRNA-1 protein AED:0.00 eAED:0.00 QI:78/1/1/1/1/1/2/12/528